MMTGMTHEEFVTWKELDKISPVGPKRLDFQTGLIAATVRNVQFPKSKPKSPSDFMPLQKRMRAIRQEIDSKFVDDQVRSVMGGLMAAQRARAGNVKSGSAIR